MTQTLFPIPPVPLLDVVGEDAKYPVARIFCVGRNYAAHAAEMGNTVDREAPFYFTKSQTAFLASGGTWAYPAGSENVHHEMEFAFAIGRDVFRAEAATAMDAVYGYACALDMTRRDVQAAAKDKRRPWDLAKDVEGSAIVAPLTKASDFGAIGDQRIAMSINGEIRQDAALSDMIHSVSDIIVHLSHYYHLRAGDLILTGTPAGVGPVAVGDEIAGQIAGLTPLSVTIGAPD